MNARVPSCHRFLAVAAALALVAAVAPAGANAAAPQTVSCGETITQSIVVGNDLICLLGQTGLTVGANRITIDLNGHAISGVFSPALSSSGHSHVTIENGTLSDNARALQLSGDHYDTVRNVQANGGGEGAGVSLSGGSHNRVVDSTLSSAPECCAPLELNNETNDKISANTALGYKGLQIGAGAGNRVTSNETARIDVTGSLDLIKANMIAPDSGLAQTAPGVSITGDDNSVTTNTVSGLTASSGSVEQFPEGINVTGSGNTLKGNTADHNAGDGIHVLTAGNLLTANVANDNGSYGIEAVPGVIDGGRNRASGNGNPVQCLNIVCSAKVPATPSGVTATPGNGSVALSWQANAPSDAVSHYSVYRTDQSFSGPWATPTGTTFTNVSDVTDGTKYCYQITATNTKGESAKTAPVCATATGP